MRPDARRSLKYRIKLNGKVMDFQPRQYTASAQAQVNAEQLIKGLGTPAIMQNYYMIFAKELLRILRRHKGEIAHREACIEKQKWLRRGLDEDVLERIIAHNGMRDCLGPPPPPPPPCVWVWKRKLTFSGNVSGEDLLFFPVLVHLTGSNFDFGHARTNGEDLRFMAGDLCPGEGTPLKHEIEYWNAGESEAWVWVKAPKITGGSATDFIYLFYGNAAAPDVQDPAAVWAGNFRAVWHLRSETTNIPDSTANARHGTKLAADEPVSGHGKLDGLQTWDGIDDYVDLDAVAALMRGIENGTIEVWLYPEQTPVVVKFVLDFAGDVEEGNREIVMYQTDEKVMFMHHGGAGWGGATLTSTGVVTPGGWHKVVCTWGSAGMKIYIDGEPSGTDANTTGTTDQHTMGKMAAHYKLWEVGVKRFEGSMTEMRVEDAARSAAWVKAAYLSENDQFISYGGEEAG